MEKILAIILVLAIALSLASCGAAGNKPESTVIPQTSTSTDSFDGSGDLNQWVGVYKGDDVTIEIEEQVAGTLSARINERLLLDCSLVLEGETASGSVLIQPEMQGGDMNLEAARERFPNCLYEFTLSLDGISMTYHRVLRLTYMGEADRPEQVEELSANLRKTTKNSN